MSVEWKTDAFRSSLVRKLEEAIRESGSQNQKSAVEAEKQIFTRASSKEDYLANVARLILHVKQQGRGVQQTVGDPNQQQQQQQQNQQQQQQQNQQQQLQQQQGYMQQSRMQQPGGIQMQQQPVRMGMSMQQPGQQQMMQQQQIMQMRARLQQQQQQPQQQQMQLKQQQQMQMQQQLQKQQQTGPRLSQLQQALQQRVDMTGMRQPGMVMPGPAPPPGYGMRGPAPSPVSLPNQGPSPIPYAQSPQGQMGNPSPGGTMIPSPIGGQSARSGGPGSLAPSPSSQVNTPLNQPASQEEREYFDKVKQLEKYIEPLRKMILRIGNDDTEKLGKMKKLLDIMSNPDKRMPLATLQKCEDVLKRMQLDTTDSDQPEVGGADKNPLVEAVLMVRQSGRTTAAPNILNNTLARTFLPPMQAVLGPEICVPPLPPTPPPMEAEDELLEVLQGEVARLDPRFKVWYSGSQPNGQTGDVEIVCQLDDRDLPTVPHLVINIPRSYPEMPPECCNLEEPDYLSTPFLCEVSDSLVARLDKMASQYSLSQLLTAWELSVRSACSPVHFARPAGSITFGC